MSQSVVLSRKATAGNCSLEGNTTFNSVIGKIFGSIEGVLTLLCHT